MKTLATHPELVRAWLLAVAGMPPPPPARPAKPAPAKPLQH
ncbi:hypothetical protein [Massilia yuzhufengensis]|uniref:Uncharacterized protein n=1 Tax=Massilia yuzhufengensis TaxID=1164594 RepID=A0A1I1T631_9BURK|nr:hypothetical protein [Massilia yuzhufengensis]SFD54081.1 hypothetical protein SAMN05216204_1289 [Massilia yuzhufengensis]